MSKHCWSKKKVVIEKNKITYDLEVFNDRPHIIGLNACITIDISEITSNSNSKQDYDMLWSKIKRKINESFKDVLKNDIELYGMNYPEMSNSLANNLRNKSYINIFWLFVDDRTDWKNDYGNEIKLILNNVYEIIKNENK